jgi:hypothetical protein
MNHPRVLPWALLIGAVAASSALGQVQRTFVSGMGSDGNPCSRTAPCRTFGQAISQTNAGGEVIALDSAGYGPATITKAIAITAPLGVYAGISVSSGDGVTINAGSSDIVILRGLTVNNQGSFGNGIRFNTGGTLHLENCVVNGFSFASGVFFNGAGNLRVRDSIMRGNGAGIFVEAPVGTAAATIDHVRLEGPGTDGLVVGGGATVTVSNTTASGCFTGFLAITRSSAPADLNIENSTASSNTNGIAAGSTSTGVATVRISNSTVTDNGTGLNNDAPTSVLLSRGNNTVEGNATNTNGTIGSYAAK